MVKYDIDKLIHHRVRAKTFAGKTYEGEVIDFESSIETGRNSEEMTIYPGTGSIAYTVDEDECESLEILD